jgi:hypothetical protein
VPLRTGIATSEPGAASFFMPARLAKTGALGIKLGTARAPPCHFIHAQDSTFLTPFFVLPPIPLYLCALCCVRVRVRVRRCVSVCHETVSVRPSNAGRGLPTVPAVVMLLDEPTGLPVALMQASSPQSLCYTTVVVELTFLFHFPIFPSTGDAADRHPHCGGLRGRHQRAGQEERARHGGVRYDQRHLCDDDDNDDNDAHLAQ